MVQADQEVPEWLEDLAKGMSHRPRQDENKKDYRKGRHVRFVLHVFHLTNLFYFKNQPFAVRYRFQEIKYY